LRNRDVPLNTASETSGWNNLTKSFSVLFDDGLQLTLNKELYDVKPNIMN